MNAKRSTMNFLTFIKIKEMVDWTGISARELHKTNMSKELDSKMKVGVGRDKQQGEHEGVPNMHDKQHEEEWVGGVLAKNRGESS